MCTGDGYLITHQTLRKVLKIQTLSHDPNAAHSPLISILFASLAKHILHHLLYAPIKVKESNHRKNSVIGLVTEVLMKTGV